MPDEKGYQYFEELLESTHTTRSDWLRGTREIAEALGSKHNAQISQNKTLKALCYYIHNDGGQTDALVVMRRDTALAYVAEQEAKEAAKQNGGLPPVRPLLINTETGVPIADKGDVQELKIAINKLTWELKDVVAEMKAGIQAIKELRATLK